MAACESDKLIIIDAFELKRRKIRSGKTRWFSIATESSLGRKGELRWWLCGVYAATSSIEWHRNRYPDRHERSILSKQRSKTYSCARHRHVTRTCAISACIGNAPRVAAAGIAVQRHWDIKSLKRHRFFLLWTFQPSSANHSEPV